MSWHLTVREPFTKAPYGTFYRGQHITDPEIVKAVNETHHHFVIQHHVVPDHFETHAAAHARMTQEAAERRAKDRAAQVPEGAPTALSAPAATDQ